MTHYLTQQIRRLMSYSGVWQQAASLPEQIVSPEFVDFYAQFIKPGDLCFDVGANIGNRTDIFLELKAQVVCIEPQPACVETLQKKYHDNPCVTIVPLGVSAQSGVLSLAICDSANTLSTFSRKWQSGRFADQNWNRVIEVPVTTLDRLIAQFGCPVFCKIDVEGFEREVLHGLTSLLPMLSFEFTKEFIHDATLCLEYLEKIGPVNFNYSLGESALLSQPEWIGSKTLLAQLENIENPLLWGDIYAKAVT